ncbi:MAG: DHA2 family efflux MFS transporter permease subunit [Chitinophagales bacterium]
MHDEPQRINWSVILVLLIGAFMAFLNGSTVNVALPKLMNVFNATTDSIKWVLTCYLMTLGVTMPVSGYLGDTFGYKRVYLMALVLFTLGSALCGLSWNVGSMVAARIIQGIGGGIMSPLVMAFIYRSAPRSRMGLVLGIYGIAAGFAPAIGPTLGGYLVDYLNWRIIFYLNVPIGLVTLLLGSTLLQETELIKGKYLDWPGILSSTVGLFCLLLALSQGTAYGWTSTYIMSLLVVATVSLVFFIYNELHHPEPILELRLFEDSRFTVATIISCFINIGLFGGTFLMPILLQNVLGQSALKAGLILCPAGLVMAVVMPISGRLYDKYGAKWVIIIGMTIAALTTLEMGKFNLMTPFVFITMCVMIRGVGMGLAMMPVRTVGLIGVPTRLIGKGSALSNVILQVAASFGITVFTTIMQHRQVFHYANLAQSINMNGTSGAAMSSGLKALAVSNGLSASTTQSLSAMVLYKEVVKLSILSSITDCFYLVALFFLIGLAMTFLLKENRGKSTASETQP